MTASSDYGIALRGPGLVYSRQLQGHPADVDIQMGSVAVGVLQVSTTMFSERYFVMIRTRASTRYGLGHFFINVVLPMTFGASIYICFRATNLLVFHWIDAAGLLELTMSLRGALGGIRLPLFILYSVPDGLWVFATTSWMIHVWHGRPPWPWLLVGLVLGTGGEFGQAAGVVPGTYQHEDIWCYCMGFLLTLFQIRGTHEE